MTPAGLTAPARRRALVVLAAMAALLAMAFAPAPRAEGGAGAEPPGARVPAASDGEHLWAAFERNTPAGREHVLLHHARGMNGAFARRAFAFRQAPLAVAAEGGRVWVVLDAAPGARREVATALVARNPATGAFYDDPPGRMELRRSLAREGDLRGLVAADGALFALRAGATLERLGSGDWEAVPGAPAADEIARLVRLDGRPAVLAPDGRARVLARDGSWSDATLAVPKLLDLIPGAARPAAMAFAPEGGIALLYLRDGGTVALATIQPPPQPWALLGEGDDFALLIGTGEGGAAMRRIDGVRGEIAPAQVLAPQPIDPRAWLHLPILGMVVLATILSAFLLRSAGPQGAVPVPEGCEALPIGQRVGALLIDLLPGFGVALMLGAGFGQVAVLPLWTTDLQAATWGVAALLIALLVSTTTEAITGTSLGKWIVGGRVVRVEPAGAKPRFWQTLVRNFFKSILLLAPIAGLFTIIVPGGRGLGEVASRTAVVRAPAGEQALKPPPSERR